jgi:sulfotransferase
MKTFYFLAGLPRSGSTVLASILNQNPEVYVTPTSPMLDLLVKNQDVFWELPSVLANPCPDQLTNVTRAMINAMWEHRPEPIIIDKNRGWGKNMPASKTLLEKNIKVIATVRDLPSIMASWLTLLRNNPESKMDELLKVRGYPVNDESRMGEMWFNMVKDCMESVVQLKKDASDRLLLIDYDDLMRNPQIILEQIEQFLLLPKYEYDFDNIESDTEDDDMTAWGLHGMHKIRPKLQKTSKHPRDILGRMLYERFVQIEKEYGL